MKKIKHRYKALKEKQEFTYDDFTLRPVKKTEVEQIRIWRNKQMDVLRQKSKISRQDQIRYFSDVIYPDMENMSPSNILLSFIYKDLTIGYGGLVHISWEDSRAEVSFLLDPDSFKTSSEYCFLFKQYLTLIKCLAFNHLEMKKIFTETYEFRKDHIGVLEESGFQLEGRLQSHIFYNGNYIDSLMHGIINYKK